LKIFSTFLGMLFGLALLAAFLAGTYYLFEYIASLFGLLEPQIKTVTIIAAIVAFFCAAIIASGFKAGRTNNVSAQKINLYQRLLEIWSERLKHSSGGEELVVGEMAGLEQQLALQGSPKVIAAYMNLRRSVKQEEKSGDDAIDLQKKLLLEMRADIGQKEMNFSKNDLLDLLLGRH
jgi:hypothetical protein